MEGDPQSKVPRRVFLGWDGPPLGAAAEWLASADVVHDASSLVALPGSRAGRALRERLARASGPNWLPPRILTAGELIDELLEVRGTPASRLVRTMAWQKALAELPVDTLRALVPQPPDASDVLGWSRLAEEARRLFGEIAAEGLSFGDVARESATTGGPRESARWEALAQVQAAMTGQLANADLVDPHLARLEALGDGRVRGDRPIVLVGVADSNTLLRRALAATPAAVTALVFAPEALSTDFDEFGFLSASKWSDRDVDLPLERWRIVDAPDDQARQVCSELAPLAGRYTADDVTIGIADPEVVPHLVRRLADADVRARDAAGTPLDRTSPVRLVQAVADFLTERDHFSLAALVRHPDLRTLWKAGSIDDAAVPATIDEWQRQHLPAEIPTEWPRTSAARDAQGVWECLRDALGELADESDRPLIEWSDPVRRFLIAVYDETVSDDSATAQRFREALAEIGSALAEIEAVPPSLAPSLPAAGALGLLSRVLTGVTLPPAPPALRQATVDLLGWFDLPLDDAPALIVTGFQEGRVPDSVRADAFLPNGLRRQLGLVDDARRVARDAYAIELLSHTRGELILITGRRSAARDPLLPSRLAFHAHGDELRARVRHAFTDRPTPTASTRLEPLRSRSLPRTAGAIELPTVSATAFRDFLMSPYLFYVRHVLKIDTLDDRAEELDALAFGTLAHEVLAAFGASDRKNSSDPATIEAFLVDDLDRRMLATYGARPLPALTLQREQLRWRFQQFARRQAERHGDGWRIERVEWSPKGGRSLGVQRTPVAIRGRIDRIDRNQRTGEWAILDYKTSEQAKDPTKTHRTRDGRWLDLQLPLYAWMCESLIGDDPMQMGYVCIGRTEASVRFWDAAGLRRENVPEALEEARSIVTKVRKGDVFDLGKPPAHLAPTLAALLGTDLLVGDASATEGEDS